MMEESYAKRLELKGIEFNSHVGSYDMSLGRTQNEKSPLGTCLETNDT